MVETLRHRGPDGGGVFVCGSAGLGFRRLSIIDLEGGDQPMTNESGDLVLVMNGEIYNFQELRSALAARGHRLGSRSDAEVILHLYEERGADLVHDLVGMFAFALLDLRASRPRVLLCRDRLGIKPLFWSETPDGLLWASEPKAILHLEATPRRLRPEGLLDYLVQGYIGGEWSAWEGIRRLPPAHLLTWEAGGSAEVRRYWDLPTDSLREPAAEDEVLEWLDKAVHDHLVADVPLGAFLSGGIDSGAVATSMVRSADGSTVTCSVGFEDASHDERRLARQTAERLGTDHHEEVSRADPALALETLPWHFDEPHADPSNVPTYVVSDMARRHVKVALSGDGGDETFAGYRHHALYHLEDRVRGIVGPAGRALFRLAGRYYPRLDRAPGLRRGRSFLRGVGGDPAQAYWNGITHLERREALALLHPDLARYLAEHDPFDAFAAHFRRPSVDDTLYRAQYADFHTFLPEQILAKVDRASMARSLEVRVPLLDHRFCGRFAHLPAGQKIRRGKGKHIFRQALRGRLPAAVLAGPKRGFDTPLRSWIAGPLSGSVAEAIETLPSEWFDHRRLRQALEQHRRGARGRSRLLWSLLVLERWRRRHRVTGLAA